MAALHLDQALAAALRHYGAGRLAEAEVLYREVLQETPLNAEARHGLGLIGHAMGANAAAAALIARAIELAPEVANYHNSLGEVHRVAGRMPEAEACLRRALALQPEDAMALSNLGIICARGNRLPEAIATFERAIAADPGYCFAHDGLGLTLLLAGDLARGWREQEWCWQKEEFRARLRPFPQPRWEGQPLAGRTLLVHAEQGFGDTIQFARYVRALVAQGETVIFEPQREVCALFAGEPAFGRVVPFGEELPPFDLHCPLLSLPLLLGTTLETVPAEVPYLQPDPARARAWRERLAPGGGPLIGLIWAGRPQHAEDRARSLAPAELAPLAEVEGLRFVSLQKGPAATPGLPPAFHALEAGPELQDFAATAALLPALDLLIAADTAAVHLAGALALPVWTLLPWSPDWRWMLERTDTPWYPTMRLYRQPTRGDWAAVIRQVAADLRARFPAR